MYIWFVLSNPSLKFRCCTQLYIVSSALGFFCPRAPSAQPKSTIEIWGCQGGPQYSKGLISSSIYGISYCLAISWMLNPSLSCIAVGTVGDNRCMHANVLYALYVLDVVNPSLSYMHSPSFHEIPRTWGILIITAHPLGYIFQRVYILSIGVIHLNWDH